ncbi:MAG: hypothetical protein KatS3mg062_0274 [Tepidiforma sp.]|nr:MAG: hypothetical protein KatS3mg062_0274 [Tepidiforma sp.]
MGLFSRPERAARRDPGPALPAFVLLAGAATAAVGALVYLAAVLSALAGDSDAAPAGTTVRASSAGEDARGWAASAGDPTGSLQSASDAGSIERAIRAALSPAEAATTGVAVMTPDGELIGGLNADQTGYAASTFKLAVLLEVERRVSIGTLSYDDRIAMTDEARAEDLGTLDRLPLAEDGTLSVGEALEAMITYSDNASAVLLLRLLGPADIDATLRGIGAWETSVNDPSLPTSAADLARVMAALVRGEGLTDAARAHALDLLFAQEVRAGIPEALEEMPGVMRVGNKTGTWPNATRDVAWVETASGGYILAVMTEGDWNWELVQRVARAVHEELTSR